MANGIDFPTIYRTDLLYVPQCWQLCGNAHCCNFSRLKAQFKLIGGHAAQELPLLPGEYDFLRSHDMLKQFGDYDHRILPYDFGKRRLTVETIISRRPGCACDHSTRPTVCRLYPLLPIFDDRGTLTGVDRMGLYDALEELEGAERICQITKIPFEELPKFLAIVNAIAESPLGLFYIRAYKTVQDHLRDRLRFLRGESARSYFSIFEAATLRRRLLDHDVLGAQLETVASEIEECHGRLDLDQQG